MTELEGKLTEAAALRDRLAEMGPVQDRLDELKYEIMQLLDAAGSDKSQPTAGIYALKSQRVSVQVTEPQKLASWMADNNLNLDDFTKFDTKAVTALQERELGSSGELLPGTQVAKTEYVSLRPVSTKSNLKTIAKEL